MPILLDRNNDNSLLKKYISEAKSKYRMKSGEKAIEQALHDIMFKMPELEKQLEEFKSKYFNIKEHYEELLNAHATINYHTNLAKQK